MANLYSHDELKGLLKDASVSDAAIHEAQENEGSLGLEDLANVHLGMCDYIDTDEEFYLQKRQG